MNYFRLIPARTLTELADKYVSSVNGWLDKWARKPGQIVRRITVSNAYENSEKLASCKQICSVNNVAGNLLWIYDSYEPEAEGFNSIFLGKDYVGKRNDLILAIKNDAIQSLCRNMFDLSGTDVCYQSDVIGEGACVDEYLRRGKGSVIVSIEIDHFRLYMLITHEIINTKVRQPTSKTLSVLDKIELEDLQLQSREILLNVKLNKTVLTYRELVNLKKYDVLVLDHRLNEKIRLSLDDKSFGEADLGSLNGNKAILFS